MNTQLRSIVADTLGLSDERVQPSLSRDSTSTWDSLNHLRLITAVEEAFHIKLSMAEIESVDTIDALDRYVCSHAPKQ